MKLNAPIALFVFKRPEHIRRTLESLAGNAEFLDSHLFIYSDGARSSSEKERVDETRKIIREWAHPNKTIIERDKNWGLANSVIAGVTDLCEQFGRVIVVEDDLIVSPVFLGYMNTALSYYQHESKVMQISGHMFPVGIESENDAVMLPFTTSWGWATWNRAWQYFDPSMEGYEKVKADRDLRHKFDLDGGYPAFKMLERQKEGAVDSWAIRWYLSVFLAEGLVLFPNQTLVNNEGFDGSGSNCKNPKLRVEVLRFKSIEKFPDTKLNELAFMSVKVYLYKEKLLLNKIIKYVGGVWKRLMG